MAKIETTSSYCNECTRETNHRVLYRKKVDDSFEVENHGWIGSDHTWELLQCAGCDTVSARHSHWFEPHADTTVQLYPPRVARERPSWRSHIPVAMRMLLNQVYTALDTDSRALALMGARAVLDMLLVEKVGDVGAFAKKLDRLEASGVIGGKNREVLEAALDAGNAAAHRGYQPSADDLNAVMDILENLLQAVYHLGSLADRLKKTTPRRQRTSIKKKQSGP